MSVEPSGSDFGDDRESQWDAYSDYALVSRRVTGSISDAMDAYALLDSAIKTGYKVSAQEEAQLRADILGAAMRLRVELESERESRDVFDEMLSRWEGEDGYIDLFRNVDLTAGRHDWLADFASDIRRAGWELGYLKAGTQQKGDAGGNKDDSDVRELFEEMKL